MLMEQIAKNWKPLIVILIATILCLILYIFSSGDVRNFALSLGTCFLSALVVVIAVDISLSASAEQTRRGLFTISLHSLRPAFYQIGGVLFNLIKATAEHPQEDGEVPFSKITEMMRKAETQYINARHEAPVLPSIDWLTYVTSAFNQLTESLNKFSEKYIMFIDQNTIELCDKMCSHRFIYFCNQARTPLHLPDNPGDFGAAMIAIAFTAPDENTPSPFQDYLTCLEQLNNKLLAANIKIIIPIGWSNNTAPALGSARTATA